MPVTKEPQEIVSLITLVGEANAMKLALERQLQRMLKNETFDILDFQRGTTRALAEQFRMIHDLAKITHSLVSRGQLRDFATSELRKVPGVRPAGATMLARDRLPEFLAMRPLANLLERAAYHEAGHATAAIAFGIPIIRVTIAEGAPHLHRDGWHVAPDLGLECIVALYFAEAEA